MIKAQQADLNSCCVTNTYNAKKCQVSLSPDEELVGVIAIGYGATDGTQHKSKSMENFNLEGNAGGPCRRWGRIS